MKTIQKLLPIFFLFYITIACDNGDDEALMPQATTGTVSGLVRDPPLPTPK